MTSKANATVAEEKMNSSHWIKRRDGIDWPCSTRVDMLVLANAWQPDTLLSAFLPGCDACRFNDVQERSATHAVPSCRCLWCQLSSNDDGATECQAGLSGNCYSRSCRRRTFPSSTRLARNQVAGRNCFSSCCSRHPTQENWLLPSVAASPTLSRLPSNPMNIE